MSKNKTIVIQNNELKLIRGDVSIFVFENVFVVAEYTCSQDSDVGDHLKKKKIVYDKILGKSREFVAFLKSKFPKSAAQLEVPYHPSKLIVKIIYCSRNNLDNRYKLNVPGPVYMDYPAVRYFGAVTGAIKRSSRYELLYFLGVNPTAIGSGGKIEADLQQWRPLIAL